MSSAFERRLSELDALLREVEGSLSGRPLEAVRAIVGALMDSHRDALGELVARLSQDELERLVQDRSIESMLSLHGLYVLDAERRVRRAIREVDAASGEGTLVEVLALEASRVRVGITAKEPHVARDLKEMVDAALAAQAPDVTVEYETPAALIPIDSLVRGERCDVCGGRLPDAHEHLLDAHTNHIRCACARCATEDTSGTRRIVTHAAKLDGPTEQEWETLGIPVGLAAVMVDSRNHEPVVLYPGAAGMVHGVVSARAWESLRASYPSLSLKPDVEAVLAYSAAGSIELYRVGIDTCFRLVGLLRQRSESSQASRVRTFLDELGGAS